MEHIRAFDRVVADIVKRNPEHQAIKAIEKCRMIGRKTGYYNLLDNLGLRFGIEYQVIQVCDVDRDKVVGYIPAIKFHRVNPLTEACEEVVVKELRLDPMRSYSKCHAFVAKEYLYTLMQVTDLEKYILGNGVVA